MHRYSDQEFDIVELHVLNLKRQVRDKCGNVAEKVFNNSFQCDVILKGFVKKYINIVRFIDLTITSEAGGIVKRFSDRASRKEQMKQDDTKLPRE